MGQFIDTRYSRDVVVNGPLRSMLVVRTMNWRTGKGFYELEQYYTSYRNKSWSTCKAVFTTFMPEENSVAFGCAMRSIMNEYDSRHAGGTVISYGRNVEIESPSPDESKEDRLRLVLDFEGLALVVKDKYRPEYRRIESYGGNHAFMVPANGERVFEYLFAGAWSEGMENRTAAEFSEYMRRTALEFNNPLEFGGMTVETK
jgi:hypothetical protein